MKFPVDLFYVQRPWISGRWLPLRRRFNQRSLRADGRTLRPVPRHPSVMKRILIFHYPRHWISRFIVKLTPNYFQRISSIFSNQLFIGWSTWHADFRSDSANSTRERIQTVRNRTAGRSVPIESSTWPSTNQTSPFTRNSTTDRSRTTLPWLDWPGLSVSQVSAELSLPPSQTGIFFFFSNFWFFFFFQISEFMNFFLQFVIFISNFWFFIFFFQISEFSIFF